MHTSFQLNADLFNIEINGRNVGIDALLPKWNQHDRVGVIVSEPFGMLGASLFVQGAITKYYDYRRKHFDTFSALLDGAGERESVAESSAGLEGIPSDPVEMAKRGEVAFPGYAEIYVLHVGRAHGNHMAMDIWPPHREPIVPKSTQAVASAIVDFGITRLLVQDSPLGNGAIDWDIRSALRERIVDVFIYSNTGRVADADVKMSGTSDVVEQNPDTVLNMRRMIDRVKGAVEKLDAEYPLRGVRNMESRLHEVPDEVREQILRDRRSDLVDGARVETFRRVSLQSGLETIDGLCRSASNF